MSINFDDLSRLKHLFPLATLDDVVALFDHELIQTTHPDLTLLSLVIGIIENNLTLPRFLSLNEQVHRKEKSSVAFHDSIEALNSFNETKINEKNSEKSMYEIPLLELETLEPFYIMFVTQVKGSIDLSEFPKKTSRELIKKVSDVIWSNLTRSYYKDKAHLQTLFSYMTGNRLDCFGVAYAVVAACQILGLEDVKLALSEDHAWVVYGDNQKETAEVTWHGKGNEDKRGQPVYSANCWLYLNGYPVICSPQMTVAALASAINPSINATMDSEPLIALQHKLLWLLYQKGHLSKYPMAVGNLGDLEEISPTPHALKTSLDLFLEGIEINKHYYDNHHVYPYSYLAGFYFRNGRYKEALQTWAEAASVIRNYNYTRDDEEIYKEFLEIANELIPHIVKVISAGGCEPAKVSNIPLLQDPECFASLLVFYDGLCGWEEDSSTPVLHIGWAKPFVATISKFSPFTRNKVKINVNNQENNEDDEEEKAAAAAAAEQKHQKKSSHEQQNEQGNVENQNNQIKLDEKACHNHSLSISIHNNGSSSPVSSHLSTSDDIIKSLEEKISGKMETDSIKLDPQLTEINEKEDIDPQIAELAAACGEQILNPDYLLGNSNQPTLKMSTIFQPSSNSSPPSPSLHSKSETIVIQSDAQPISQLDMSQMKPSLESSNNDQMRQLIKAKESKEHDQNDKVIVNLTSHKMVGLNELLLAEKLNTSAIQLQLTAQSQVHLSKRTRGASLGATHSEFDFLATTTLATSLAPLTGQRTSKRHRRD